MHIMRSAGAAVALMAMVTLGLVACGSAGTDTGSGTGATGDASATTTAPSDADQAAGPVTIDHVFGSTEISEVPERIVSLDTQWTDVLVALDHPPAAYVVDPSVDGELPWREGLMGDAEPLEATNELPFEAVAAQRPDLIVVTYLAQDEADYQALSAIAPTIAALNPNRVDSWQELTTVAGDVLGDPAAAESVIASVDEEVAATAAELPGLEGRTVAMANYVPGDAIYVVADPEDGANLLFEDLGLTISPTILDQPGVDTGRVELSLENIGLLDADLLVFLLNGADPDDIAGYDALPAVETGAVADLDYETVTGLNTPSPLSIPYSLEAIRPALEAAAEG